MRKGWTAVMSSASARSADDADSIPPRELLLADAEALTAWLRARLLAPDAPPADPIKDTALLNDPRLLGRVPRQAAVLAPLYARDGQPYLLFTQRSADLSTHSGEISFPGGSRDPADRSLAQTALRESHEELGLEPARVTLLGLMPPAYTVVSNFLVTPYVGWLGEGLPALRPQTAEVAEIIEAPLSALDDHLIYHTEQWTRGGVTHAVHFYDFGPYRIWGFTGRLLNDLLALLPPRA
jgi:8-oxo-dGTP pyrophosphatase MutT (NUDIX family)